MEINVMLLSFAKIADLIDAVVILMGMTMIGIGFVMYPGTDNKLENVSHGIKSRTGDIDIQCGKIYTWMAGSEKQLEEIKESIDKIPAKQFMEVQFCEVYNIFERIFQYHAKIKGALHEADILTNDVNNLRKEIEEVYFDRHEEEIKRSFLLMLMGLIVIITGFVLPGSDSIYTYIASGLVSEEVTGIERIKEITSVVQMLKQL